MGIPTSAVVIVDVYTTPVRSLDVEVVFDVDLEDSGYQDPNDLEVDMDDLVNDPTSTLYEGNITSSIDPDTYVVVGVFLYTNTSVSSSLPSFSSSSADSGALSSSISQTAQDSSLTPLDSSSGILPSIVLFSAAFVLNFV